MRPELPGQLPMFDVKPTKVRKSPLPLPAGRVKWTEVKSLRSDRCDDCFAILVAAEGKGPRCRPARWRRITQASELVLCAMHAQDRRVEDGLPPLPVKEKS